jgi:hypothetical protein
MMLVKVKYRRTGPKVVTSIFSIDRIDGILAKIPEPGRLGHSQLAGLLKGNLVITHGNRGVESDCSRVLANGKTAPFRKVDIGFDQGQRQIRARSRRLQAMLKMQHLIDILGQTG